MEEYYPDIIKALIAAIITLTFNRVKSHLPERKQSKHDDSFDILRGVMAQGIEGRPNIVIEHAFKDYLKFPLNYSEIIRLINLQNPLKAFRLYESAQFMVEYNEFSKFFEYKEKYNNEKKRKSTKRRAFAAYFLYAFLALMTLMYAPILVEVRGFQGFAFIFFFLVFLLPAAWFMLEEYGRSENAAHFLSFLEKDSKYYFKKSVNSDPIRYGSAAPNYA
ncbi:hypothetical protein SAMN05216429_10957 [Marinobacter persicus]|uniref:Uncharacterized protein n=1 Tax=Marinobacter persicus TaxID=930118 RepID=A0A1I3W6K2_9GAMM|nr:hypothetical protein [Marinobacter persicus]GHD46914.1 hypothetical protein GCM10008110_14140 [Marinobacter persicus]SFK03218.1 hypothetical protein SAMN05216429_10957 [Marinobacter persicus]